MIADAECPVCDGAGVILAIKPIPAERLLEYLLRALDWPISSSADAVRVTCQHNKPKALVLAEHYAIELPASAEAYPGPSEDVILHGEPDEPHGVLCRPPAELAGLAVRSFVTTKLRRDDFPLTIVRDGPDGYAFWLLSEDGTSYLHHDLRIEWYGTDWDGWGDEDDETPKGEEVSE